MPFENLERLRKLQRDAGAARIRVADLQYGRMVGSRDQGWTISARCSCCSEYRSPLIYSPSRRARPPCTPRGVTAPAVTGYEVAALNNRDSVIVRRVVLTHQKNVV